MGLVTAHERMANVKLRQAIALEAARLMYERTESEYYTAKRKAAKRLCRQTVKPIERASIRELEELLLREYPGIDIDKELEAGESAIDPYQLYRMLLLPLENVKQPTQYHPEGDALYHTLQVFELAREHRPYDEEFLLAALLHDVGKGIDRHDHVVAGLSALEGLITERTRFFIEHHMH